VLAAGAIATRRPRAAVAAATVATGANVRFYRLLARRMGPVGVAAGVPLHALHYLSAAVAVPLGIVHYLHGLAVDRDVPAPQVDAPATAEQDAVLAGTP
jgi:hypothetical protein